MKLKIKMHLVQKVKYVYPEFEIDTAEFPELEGKTLDEIRLYIEKHGHSLHPIHEGYDNLLDELKSQVKKIVVDTYPHESKFFITAEDEMYER